MIRKVLIDYFIICFMWITRLKLKHKDCPIVNRCEKFDLVVLSYPSVWYEKRGKKFATTICYFQSGDEKEKKRFLRDLRVDKRVTNLDVAGDIFTYEINLGKTGEHVMIYQKKQIFFVKPTVNHLDGHEYWEVASWDRKVLEKFMSELEKHMDIFEIMKFEQSPLGNVYFPNVMPKLSKSQKKAIEVAYLNGYYSYPRKTSLGKLAKILGIGVSTFQEHLRKAELKLLPAIIESNFKQDQEK